MADPKGYLVRMEAAQAAYDQYVRLGGEGVPLDPPDDAALAATRSEMNTEPPA
jgi:hypothetical protein